MQSVGEDANVLAPYRCMCGAGRLATGPASSAVDPLQLRGPVFMNGGCGGPEELS